MLFLLPKHISSGSITKSHYIEYQNNYTIKFNNQQQNTKQKSYKNNIHYHLIGAITASNSNKCLAKKTNVLSFLHPQRFKKSQAPYTLEVSNPNLGRQRWNHYKFSKKKRWASYTPETSNPNLRKQKMCRNDGDLKIDHKFAKG